MRHLFSKRSLSITCLLHRVDCKICVVWNSQAAGGSQQCGWYCFYTSETHLNRGKMVESSLSCSREKADAVRSSLSVSEACSFQKILTCPQWFHPLGPNGTGGPSALLSAGISFMGSLFTFPTTSHDFLCLPKPPSASGFPSVAGNRLVLN